MRWENSTNQFFIENRNKRILKHGKQDLRQHCTMIQHPESPIIQFFLEKEQYHIFNIVHK